MRRLARFTLSALLFFSFSLTPALPVLAASTRLVSTTGSDSGDCTASPCATISYALSQSALTGGDTISVAAGMYTTAAEITIDRSITISGAGASSTIIQAAASAGIADHRLFKNNNFVTTIQAMTVRYGVEASGGAINNANGNLTLNNVTLSDNQVKDTTSNGLNGGAISINGGTLTINNSTISNNSVTTSDSLTSRGNGGGIFLGSTGTVNLNNSTVSGNSAKRGGGGLYTNGGTINVNYSTIASNTSDSDNDAVGDGGGVTRNSGTINLTSSIVAGNKKSTSSPTDNDCSGTITTQGYNLTGSSTGCSISGTGDVTVSPSTVFTSVLGSLSDNGGETYTHLLYGGNAALDSIPSGTNSCGSGSFAADQRGDIRPYSTNCDMGAYESQDALPTVSMSSAAGDPTTTSPIPVTVTFSESVTGFTAGDITAGNGTVSNFAGSGASYTFDLTPSGEGTVTADIAAGVAQDAVHNANSAATQFSRTYDATAPTVTSFAASSPSNSLNIPITAFTASDSVGVTGYLITESSTPPTAGASGWTASAPTTYAVASAGSYTLYPWAKDAAGNVSAVYGSPASVSACLNPATVTSNADSGAGTLRQAIADACSGGTINFSASLSGGTIHVASTLTIAKSLTIDGSALATPITISGDSDNNGTGDVRVFYIDNVFGIAVTLDSLIVTKGQASGAGEDGEGGAVLNQRALTIRNSTFSNNSSSGSGGAISAHHMVTIIDSTFSGNSSADSVGGGGVIYNVYLVTIKNSTFSGNSANASGGVGGAILNTAQATIANSTFVGNTAAIGGAILTTNDLTIANSTIAGNTAGYLTGGLDIEGHTTNLSNTIIANNFVTASGDNEDCLLQEATANFGTNTNNLIEDGSCSPSLSGDPKLGALADNGGPSQTFALLAGSSAIDAGDDTTCAASPVSNLDQRGVTRPNSLHCDIGAYEYEDAGAPTVTAFTATSLTNNLNIPITAFTASDDATLIGYMVTETSTPPSAGAAGWTASAPTTYTVGSAGSHTLYPWAKDAVGNVSAAYGSPASVTVDKTAPTAGSLVAAKVTTGGGTTYRFTVTLSDNLAVDITSIGGSDIRVTGPGGFNQLATLVGVTPSGNGTPRTATYQITTPGGAWDTMDNGTYTIAVEANQIFDSAGNPVGATSLGSFLVSLNYTAYLPLVLR